MGLHRLQISLITLALAISVSVFAKNSPKKYELYKPGEVLVKLSDSAPRDWGLKVSQKLEALKIKDLGAISLVFSNWRKLSFPVDSDMNSVIKFVSKVDNVVHVEPHFLYHLLGYVPQEASFKNQWALFNSGQSVYGTSGTMGADINMLRTWNISPGVRFAAKNVVVAVIDTGIAFAHPDLNENIWTNSKEIPADGVDNDQNGYIDDEHGWDWSELGDIHQPGYKNGDNNPEDDVFHGTHVSGIIGASHNSKGVAGINAAVQLMPLRFISRTNGSVEGAVKAIEYAVQMGADVINASWGGSGNSLLISEAIGYAKDHGLLFIAAAGNDGMDNDSLPSFPSNDSNALSVAATDNNDRLTLFSNFGRNKVHIGAPGYYIESTMPPVWYAKNNVAMMSGTSMAAPQVTGVAAMLIGLFPDKYKGKPEALRKRLLESSDTQMNLISRVSSGGRLNAYNAIMGVTTPGHYDSEEITWTKKVDRIIESRHPYENNTLKEWTIKHPGAQWIRLKLGRYALESINDGVELYDTQGQIVDIISGFGMDTPSKPIKGDEVKIVFRSGKMVTGWGFEILGYEVSEER